MDQKANLHNTLKLFCFTLFLMGVLSFAYPSDSCAQNSNAGCATDTWIAMTNHAALQTRREDLMNKRYIIKPDSVLAYSCFSKETERAINDISTIFSDNNMWAAKPAPYFGGVFVIKGDIGLGGSIIEGLINSFVQAPYEQYIDNNFYQPLAETSSYREGNKYCYTMSAIWNAAKCRNFDEARMFYRLEELIATETREFPPELKCTL